MDAQRLERATQSVHGMNMGLGSVIMGAIGADKVLTSVDFGDTARALLLASLACFAFTALVGSQLIARLPLIEGDAEEVLQKHAPLVGAGKVGVLHLPIGAWRTLQHWGLLLALLLGLGGVLAISTAEDLAQDKAAAAVAVSAAG